MRPLQKLLAHLAVALAVSVGCASLLFLAAFLFLGSLRFLDFGLGPKTALVVDALLCAAFFVQHSGMVRRGFRARLRRFVPETYHGLVFTAASSAVLVLCLALWQRAGDPLIRLEGAAAWSVHAVFLVTTLGFVWGVRALGSFDTFGTGAVLAEVRGRPRATLPFAIRGPYRFVRHPLYFFVLVLIWACPVVTLDRLLFNVLWTAWVVLATRLEERDLVAEFGDSYLRYQREVPMIFPWRGMRSEG